MERISLDIAFVILHFNTVNETNNLVISIKQKIDAKNYKIVIVDNKSPNGSGAEIQQTYKDDYLVDVVLNPENIGFARGNNAGIDFVRANYDAKYICCLNNDTLMIQDNFYRVLDEEYRMSGAAVVMVKSCLPDGSVSGWVRHFWSLEAYKEKYDTYACKLCLMPLTYRVKHEIKRISSELAKFLHLCTSQPQRPYLNPECRHEDITASGCCVIFTPLFFQKLKGFDNRTFLYWEEELLHLALKKNELLSVYNPNLYIKHLESVSTKTFAKKKKERKMLVTQHLFNSLHVFIDEFEKLQRENFEKNCRD